MTDSVRAELSVAALVWLRSEGRRVIGAPLPQWSRTLDAVDIDSAVLLLSQLTGGPGQSTGRKLSGSGR